MGSHGIREYLLSLLSDVLIESHGPRDLILSFLHEIDKVSWLSLSVENLTLESRQVLKLNANLANRIFGDFVEIWETLQELDFFVMLSFLDRPQGPVEVFLRQNGKMTVFFASYGRVSRLVFNEGYLPEIVSSLKDIDFCVL